MQNKVTSARNKYLLWVEKFFMCRKKSSVNFYLFCVCVFFCVSRVMAIWFGFGPKKDEHVSRLTKERQNNV